MLYIHLFPDIQSPRYSIVSEVCCTTWTKQLCLHHLQVFAMVTPLHNERRCCVHRLQKFWRLFNCNISRKPVYIYNFVSNLNTKNVSQTMVVVVSSINSAVMFTQSLLRDKRQRKPARYKGEEICIIFVCHLFLVLNIT